MRDLDCLVKRYLNIFWVKPKFFLIIVVIPFLFYLYTLTRPVSYEISNAVLFAPDMVLELNGPEPLKLNRKRLLLEPELFLLNAALVDELDHLITRNWKNQDEEKSLINESIISSISLEVSGEEQIRIKYEGPRVSTGSLMVYFYSRKLASNASLGDDYRPDDSTREARIAGIGFYNRDLEITKNYRLWDQGRLFPLGVVTVLSFLLMLFTVAIAEWMDSSLKTEQQASRYLDLPVLGAFPNFRELEAIFSRPDDSPGPRENMDT
jgi:hypothetical protein